MGKGSREGVSVEAGPTFTSIRVLLSGKQCARKRASICLGRGGEKRTERNLARRLLYFVGTFKLAVSERRRYQALEQFLRAAEGWITFYNQLRPHEGIGNCSPDQFASLEGLPPVPYLRVLDSFMKRKFASCLLYSCVPGVPLLVTIWP
jgi:hypothetical protein